MTTFEIEANERHAVGPYSDVYDHRAVTAITMDDHDADHPLAIDYTLFVCLDCGYVTHSVRVLTHVECDPEKNTVNVSWRDRVGEALYDDENGDNK